MVQLMVSSLSSGTDSLGEKGPNWFYFMGRDINERMPLGPLSQVRIIYFSSSYFRVRNYPCVSPLFSLGAGCYRDHTFWSSPQCCHFKNSLGWRHLLFSVPVGTQWLSLILEFKIQEGHYSYKPKWHSHIESLKGDTLISTAILFIRLSLKWVENLSQK